jgi:hypothetical protein
MLIWGIRGVQRKARCAISVVPTLAQRTRKDGAPTESEGLETQPRLELDDSATETVAGTTELAGIDDVGR